MGKGGCVNHSLKIIIKKNTGKNMLFGGAQGLVCFLSGGRGSPGAQFQQQQHRPGWSLGGGAAALCPLRWQWTLAVAPGERKKGPGGLPAGVCGSGGSENGGEPE